MQPDDKFYKEYKAGARAAIAVYESVHYAYIHKPMRGMDAMKLFWPPVEEQLLQIQTPLPLDRQAWIKGFEEEQMNIQEELNGYGQ
jgi:hypothetical protein